MIMTLTVATFAMADASGGDISGQKMRGGAR